MFSDEELVRQLCVIIALVIMVIIQLLASALFALTIDALSIYLSATNDITITYNDNYPRQLMLCQSA
jgi:hypothetical protein